MISEKIVMGFGTFDVLHPGHLFYLKALKKLADKLIVVIARDQNVEKIKGKLPHFNEQERFQAVEALGIADQVVLGHESDFYEVIRQFKPSILGFGYDQHVNSERLKTHFPTLKMIRIADYHPEKYKSSLIKKGLQASKMS